VNQEDVMGDGIRSYGHGKFHTIIDSYVYAMTLDGGADREESYDEGGGWYGFVELSHKDAERIREVSIENRDQLTVEENELLDESVAVILFERSDGIVEADWFTDMKEAEAQWAEIEAEFDGDEDEVTYTFRTDAVETEIEAADIDAAADEFARQERINTDGGVAGLVAAIEAMGDGAWLRIWEGDRPDAVVTAGADEEEEVE